ncbi:MAG: CBS domain-containing protein [Acidobacteria bacterium]|nr:CBS domain-containing protein [Acidobacteriota bacterium]
MSIERLSALTQEQRNQLSVFDAMTKNPLWVTLDDSPLLVAEMMRERSLKRLPVVYAIDDLRIAGQVRLEVLMALVIRGVDETSSLS